jgi:hypothetical protein
MQCVAVDQSAQNYVKRDSYVTRCCTYTVYTMHIQHVLQAAEDTDVVRQETVYNTMMLRRGLKAVDAVACSNPHCDNRYYNNNAI